MAERANRTLVEMTRSLLIHSGMPKSLWAETAGYIRNRSPTAALVRITPYEAFSDKTPSVGHMRVFGSLVVGPKPKVRNIDLDISWNQKGTGCTIR